MRVIGIGAGGHASVMIDILRLVGGYEVVGLLDLNEKLWGTTVLGVPVLGNDALLMTLSRQGVSHAFLGIGTIGETRYRREVYYRVREHGFQMVSVVHPSAVIAPSARIGPGPTIMANAVISSNAQIGEAVIVNTGAIIEHDCVVEAHVHIATGAKLCSAVRIGAGVHVGAGATVRQGIAIGEGAVVGAGAVVVDAVEPGTVVVGVPAQVLERVRP